VIITGPTGTIGVALTDILTKSDCEVYAICRPNSSNIKNLKNRENLHVIECDISNLLDLKSKLSGRFDAFYHFELSESVQRHLNQIAGVQIFTTTHNTDLMSNDLLRPDSYFLLANNSIKAISQLTEKELRQAHNLQKMYKAGAFNGK